MTPYQEQLKKEWEEHWRNGVDVYPVWEKTFDFFLSKMRERDEKIEKEIEAVKSKRNKGFDSSRINDFAGGYNEAMNSALEILKSNQ